MVTYCLPYSLNTKVPNPSLFKFNLCNYIQTIQVGHYTENLIGVVHPKRLTYRRILLFKLPVKPVFKGKMG